MYPLFTYDLNSVFNVLIKNNVILFSYYMVKILLIIMIVLLFIKVMKLKNIGNIIVICVGNDIELKACAYGKLGY